jgi:ankyrin repeat protein
MMSSFIRGLLLISAALLFGCSEPAPPTVNLDRAVQIGDMDQIKRHIYWKSDLNQPNAAGDPPLHVAARAGRVAIARELVRSGSDLSALNADGYSPLYIALAHGRTQVAMMLMDRGAPLDAQSMLVDLVRAGVIDRDALNFLIRSGAEVNRADPEGDTPLLVAIRNGHLDATRRLIVAGADVNQTDGTGRLPLQIARESAPGRDARFIISTLERSGARADSIP